MRIGVPKEFFVEGMEKGVERAVRDALAELERQGAELVDVSLSLTDHGLAVYYLIQPAEASANLARYDGVRYGLRVEGPDLLETYRRTRGKGFGPEVKRRMILGTYALSAGYYDAYYVKAQKVRTLIKQEFDRVFEKVDAIVTPTAPTVAFKIGQKVNDPAVDVPQRHLHAAGEHQRAARDLAPLRPVGRTAGRAAGHRQLVPGGHDVPRRGRVRASHEASRDAPGGRGMKATRRPLTNTKVERIPASGIRRFFDLIAGVEGAISLGVGEPDFVTPERFRDAAIRSIKEGKTKYTSNYGIKPLREAISEHTAKLRGVRYDVDREIIVTVGVSEAVDLAMRATLNEGDEVILADPSYVAYVPGIILAGGVPVAVPTREENNFRLLPDDVEAAITPRTRAILLGFPANPTGAVLEKSDIDGIAALAAEHDLLVYADEIYDRLVYGTEHQSILSAPDMKERTIYLAGFSKSYAMTGWRVGYACAPAEIIEQMMKIHQYTVMCVPTAAQYAALEALKTGEAEVQRMVGEYDKRRKYMWRPLQRDGPALLRAARRLLLLPEHHLDRSLRRRVLRAAAQRGAGRRRSGQRLRCARPRPHPRLLRVLDGADRGGLRPHRALRQAR